MSDKFVGWFKNGAIQVYLVFSAKTIEEVAIASSQALLASVALSVLTSTKQEDNGQFWCSICPNNNAVSAIIFVAK